MFNVDGTDLVDGEPQNSNGGQTSPIRCWQECGSVG